MYNMLTISYINYVRLKGFFKAIQIVRSDLKRPYSRYRPSLHELKVRKNRQQKTCNLFCNIAAKRVEQRCCHSAFLFFNVQQYYKADTQSQSVSSSNHDLGSSFISDHDQSYSSYFVKCRRTPIQLKSSEPYPSSETEKNFSQSLVYVLLKSVKLGITSWSYTDAEKCTKKVCSMCKVVVLLIKDIAYHSEVLVAVAVVKSQGRLFKRSLTYAAV